MASIKLTDNVYWVGVKDPGLRVFDIVMETKHGTTYNAYLIKGENHTSLIDTVKESFTDEYFSNIEEICEIDKIDYLIVNHTEPDHSGAIPELLKRNPNLKLICSTAAIPFVKNTINNEQIDLTGIKNNHELDLGGKKLIFKLTPYMHWPDTMMEYLVEDKILFSCDGFAAHVAFDEFYADQCQEDIDYELFYYFDSIMRPFSMFINKNMKKLDDLEINMIATSHGPAFRNNTRQVIDKYKDWTNDKTNPKGIAIFYASAYGNTKKVSLKIKDELAKKGYDVSLVDTQELERETARDLIEKSKVLLIGAPTFNGDCVPPVWNLLSLINTVPYLGKKAAVFGSYGWSGEGIKLVSDRLSGMRFKVFEENYKTRLIPSDTEMNDIIDYCNRLDDFISEK